MDLNFYNAMKNKCIYCNDSPEYDDSSDEIQLLKSLPDIHLTENIFIKKKKYSFGDEDLPVGIKKNYRCKDHCHICKFSSKNCFLHCIQCFKYIILLMNIFNEGAFIKRDKPLSNEEIKKERKKLHRELIFKKENLNHYHSEMDVAIFLVKYYEFEAEKLINLFRKFR